MTTHQQYSEVRPRDIILGLIATETRAREELVRQRDFVGDNPLLGSPDGDICACDERLESLRLELAEHGITEEMLTGAEYRGEVIIGGTGPFASVLLTADGEKRWQVAQGGSILLVLPAALVAEINMTPEERETHRRKKPLGKHGQLRDDLVIIPEAEAAGWKVSFRNNNWHNGAMFDRDGITIWPTGRDWRRAGVINGLTSVPEVFPYSITGLRAAMASTAELVERIPTRQFCPEDLS
jgi:hypothetical protein